ncbi:Cep120 protein-domain-containing protein [Entophlyctis helioformis]|nr:Cep120 protein-domain-containing protein [Entophlyctis helioformis]
MATTMAAATTTTTAATAAAPSARAGQYTVQITVFEGRYFARRPAAKVYVQCRFNSEILTTDPADLASPTPIWDTELAWDVDAKLLSFLRSQRVSLKLVCYAIDAAAHRDSLGYVMLDLRSATQGPPPFPERWFPLVNTKSGGGGTGPGSVFRPELKMSFTVQPKRDAGVSSASAGSLLAGAWTGFEASLTGGPRLNPAIAAQPASAPRSLFARSRDGRPPATGGALATIGAMPIELKPGGYYQLGDPDAADTMYTLWLTIAFAEHLPVLINAASSSSQTQPAAGSAAAAAAAADAKQDAGYYFYYTFLGNEITTQRFYDLANPNFPAERVSIRFKASQNDIRLFFREMAKIVIYLCAGSHTVVGFADVFLTALLDDDASDMAIVEKVYNLYNDHEELPISGDSKSPSIGVSMALSVEPAHGDAGTPGQTLDAAVGTAPPTPRVQSASVAQTPATLAAKLPPEMPSRDGETRSRPPQPLPQHINTAPLNGTPSAVPSHPPPARPVPWHQYRFSIELRSLRDVHLKSATVYLKYVYTPFGTTSPVITHPATPVNRSPHEVLLPHSFSAFEFVMSPARLRGYLEAVPLIVELWHKDDRTRDVLLGNASVDLSGVMATPKMAATDGKGGAGQDLLIQSLDLFVSVAGAGDAGKSYDRVCDLRVVLALEDFGPVDEGVEVDAASRPVSPSHHKHHHEDVWQAAAYLSGQRYETRPSSPQHATSAAKPSQQQQQQSQHRRNAPGSPSSSTTSLHDTPEYRVALDLELWRQQEEAKFKTYLRSRESDLTARLAAEFQARTRERDALLARRLDELTRLQDSLTQLSRDLETRDTALRHAETDLERRRAETERHTAAVLDEARDQARRLQDEYAHRVEMEKRRAADAEAARDRALRERDEAVARARAADADALDARRQVTASGGDPALRLELARAVQQSAELAQTVAKLQASKKYYKAELRRVFGLLADERRRAGEEDRKRVSRDREEVERLRERLLAVEAMGDVRTERESLGGARRDLDALGAAVYGTSAAAAAAAAGSGSGSGGTTQPSAVAVQQDQTTQQNREMDTETAVQVDRLTREKASLLATGIYRADDALIREFDARISQLVLSAAPRSLPTVR